MRILLVLLRAAVLRDLNLVRSRLDGSSRDGTWLEGVSRVQPQMDIMNIIDDLNFSKILDKLLWAALKAAWQPASALSALHARITRFGNPQYVNPNFTTGGRLSACRPFFAMTHLLVPLTVIRSMPDTSTEHPW